MENLSGHANADQYIERELGVARITVVRHNNILRGEVPTHLSGKLEKDGKVVFTFNRAWYYWVVEGEVPIEVANKLYADPAGKLDVRVAGMAGNDPPTKWAIRSSTDKYFVPNYHIDSEVGLRLFVDALRMHDLVDPIQV